MEKQHNRGQDGAGIATLKLNVEPGYQIMHRLRKTGSGAIKEIFASVNAEVKEIERMYPELRRYPGLMKGYLRFMGEVMLGHLRYGTQGKNDIQYCHPFNKADINPARNLMMAGNFNLVNTDQLYDYLNLQPDDFMKQSDLGAMIDIIQHFLCIEEAKVPESPNLVEVLKQSAALFDGGYVCGGLIGNGDSFVMRDPHGIRPAYYYKDDEVIVAASERPAIMTTFNVNIEDIHEILPGQAIITKADGSWEIAQIAQADKITPCSFERIYFSRGSDKDIYQERMKLGENLVPQVLEHINYDLKHTIVSFIPNTAETAFYGLIKGLESYLNSIKVQRILKNKGQMTDSEIEELIHRRVRIEKIAIKDVKLRTFITEDSSRDEMVQHVYDITYGTVTSNIDTLVVIDDSIVRGTTLKQSIIKMLARLKPKKIIIVSSAPQIRYPDCYGIDMSRLNEFIAFNAAIELLKDHNHEDIIEETYKKCTAAKEAGNLDSENFVQAIYAPFTADDISKKIASMLTPPDISIPIEIIYQSIAGLAEACPNNHGDWYFTGDYPTKGGNKVSNQAFINYIEKSNARAY